MGILIQTTSLIYIFPSSLSFSVSTRGGNEIGARRPERAKLAAIVGLLGSFVLGFSALFFAVSVRNIWASMFTQDRDIIALTSLVLPIIGLCQLGNCPQTTGCGVLRGSTQWLLNRVPSPSRPMNTYIYPFITLLKPPNTLSLSLSLTLEFRARIPSGFFAGCFPEDSFLIGFSSIFWRDASIYGNSAVRHCNLDVRHATGAVTMAATGLGWDFWVLDEFGYEELLKLMGLKNFPEIPSRTVREIMPEIEFEHPDCVLLVSPKVERRLRWIMRSRDWHYRSFQILSGRGNLTRLAEGMYVVIWSIEQQRPRRRRLLIFILFSTQSRQACLSGD